LAGTGDDVQAVPFVGMLHDQKLVAVGGVPPLLALVQMRAADQRAGVAQVLATVTSRCGD
jgi:hypothetical protein